MDALNFLLDSDLDEENMLQVLQAWQEEENNEAAASASASSSSRPPLNRIYIERDREGAHERLWNDYFSETPKYPANLFKRRFRMRRELFVRIVEGISEYSIQPIPEHFTYFTQRPDALGRLGFSAIQKCTAAIRQLAYGVSGDLFDEYLQMGERTSNDCLDNFCMCVFDLYEREYLRKPSANDIARLYRGHEQIHGFRGMLGSIDCMHWAWKNCPTAFKGQYTRGDHGHPTIMLEAVASYDLWIWHAFFGMAGSNNDINVLNASPLFDSIKNDTGPPASFDVNGHHYTKGYYLADGIYPDWCTLIKSYHSPIDEKRIKFKRFQESARKDVERAFGVLQGRFAILKLGGRSLSLNKMRRQLYCCVTLHNMIQEDNGFLISSIEQEMIDDPANRPRRDFRQRLKDRDARIKEIRDKQVHDQLQYDLTEHIWALPPNHRTRTL